VAAVAPDGGGLEPDLQPEQLPNEDDEGDKNDANNNIDNEQPPTALAAEPEGGQDQQYRYDNEDDPAAAVVDQHPNDPNIGNVPPLVAAAASAATAPVALSLSARLRQVEREALEDPNDQSQWHHARAVPRHWSHVRNCTVPPEGASFKERTAVLERMIIGY